MSFSTADLPVTIRDVFEARKRIAPLIQPTPLIYSHELSRQLNANIYLKLENLHEIGAFKIRGAANKILSLSPGQQQRGVTTFSTGNHGLAVAYIAEKLGIRAVICVSDHVARAKIDAIRRLGAEIVFCGDGQDDAENRCYELEKEQGLEVIKPFDDPYVIAGQGTIALEILEQYPQIDTAVIPLSGGGLFSGIALTLKSCDTSIRTVGVSMEKSAVMHESIKAGKPVVMKETETLADSLLGGIGKNNQYTFELVRQLADETLLVPEESIARGIRYMFDQHRMVVEGAAATGIAAFLNGNLTQTGKEIVVVISGSNIDLPLWLKIIGKEE